MKISIIIPNYNGKNLLEKNLPDVEKAIDFFVKEKGNEAELIIVDDKSTDDSLNFLNTLKYKNFKFFVLENPSNNGFSSTVNRGVIKASGEIVILLNSDVRPSNNFIVPLIDNFSDPLVFAVGCVDKNIENGKTVLRGRGIGKWEKGFLIHKRGELDKNNTLWVSGGSSAFKKEIWDKLGGMDKIYNPFYWEDIDLSYRALKSGYKILIEPKSIVIHEHEKGAIKNKFSPSEVKTIAYRNQFIFAWKLGTDFNIKLSQFIWFPYHIIIGFKNKDWSFFKGFFSSLILFPKIVQSSFEARNLFTKKDIQVIKEL